MKRILGALAAIVVLTAMAAPPCWACTCVPSTKKEKAKAADVVFTGKVTKIEQPEEGKLRVRFRVWRVYKGHPSERTFVWTPSSGAACGASFEEGQKYTVFAHWEGTQKWTTFCAGTKQGGIDRHKYGLPPAYPPNS